MFKVFYGPNRLEIEKNIKNILGEDYEVFEGEKLEVTDLPSIFLGTSLFGAEKRKILLKDMGENSAVWEKIADYTDTEHDVVIWEMKLDKRSIGYKKLKETGVEIREFTELKKPEESLVFNILDTALRDGKRAVMMAEKIELTQDPYMFFGLMATQALKKYELSGGKVREQRLVKALAKLDREMKSANMEPWVLIKGFLLGIGKTI